MKTQRSWNRAPDSGQHDDVWKNYEQKIHGATLGTIPRNKETTKTRIHSGKNTGSE